MGFLRVWVMFLSGYFVWCQVKQLFFNSFVFIELLFNVLYFFYFIKVSNNQFDRLNYYCDLQDEDCLL